jgi:hypothetical protein
MLLGSKPILNEPRPPYRRYARPTTPSVIGQGDAYRTDCHVQLRPSRKGGREDLGVWHDIRVFAHFVEGVAKQSKQQFTVLSDLAFYSRFLAFCRTPIKRQKTGFPRFVGPGFYLGFDQFCRTRLFREIGCRSRPHGRFRLQLCTAKCCQKWGIAMTIAVTPIHLRGGN